MVNLDLLSNLWFDRYLESIPDELFEIKYTLKCIKITYLYKYVIFFDFF